MIQKDYVIKKPFVGMIGPVMADISALLKKTPHRDALLIIYETGFSEFQISSMIETLKIAGPEGLKIAGISNYGLADIMPDGKGVRFNLLISESSEFEIVTLECEAGEELQKARMLRDRIKAHSDVKAVELFVCGMDFNTTGFIEEAMKGSENIPLFGTTTSRERPSGLNVTKKSELSLKEMSIGNRYKNQLLIGEKVLIHGYVAIIYYGTELSVRVNYALGWRPVGREMEIKFAPKGRLGETAIATIDDMPAVKLYHEYLGVCPDRFFIHNICEFPLMVRRDGIDMCFVPFDYGKNGELYFNMALKEDEKVSFSFASMEEVLEASRASGHDLKKFSPDAVFLIMCANRINLLQAAAPVEWNSFRENFPNCSLIHGGCELYYQHGHGGILNSAHLAIGLREGNAQPVDDDFVQEMPDPRNMCRAPGMVIPLSARMSVFLSKMTSQLEGMAKEAQAANQAKSAFLSNMSHEIRTPINAVLGMDEMILRESRENDVIKYAEDIRSAGNSLLGLINDILDFSKIEAGRLDILPVEYEVTSVINDLYNMIILRANEKGLQFVMNIDPYIPSIMYGDEIRIKQVITNILTNAVKYTEKGSVTLNIDKINDNESDGVTEEPGDEKYPDSVLIKVSVVDTGIGIKTEDIDKLYNAFERIEEERNRNIEGTGLGLNITSNLLKLMGSELNVESVYGEGSVFSFVLKQKIVRGEPVGEIRDRFAPEGTEHKIYREKFTAKDAKILVVDDTEMNLDVVKNLLKKTHIQIDTADSGEEALSLVSLNSYDLIFLDHRMPHMDGIECLKLMRAMEDNKSRRAPVISLTANAVSGAREEYLEAGFNDYLTKPIDSAKLEDMLIRYLPKDKVKLASDKDKEKSVSRRLGASKGKPSIALIDDERMIHMVAGNILGGEYRLHTYFNGNDGIEGILEKGAELILLDVKMPGMGGFDVLKELKENPRTKDIPVVFLTGDDSRDSEVEGFKEGAWDFVRKPFVPDVLLQRVRHTVELSRLQQNLKAEVNRQMLRADHLSEEVMMALSKTVDAKDHYTNGHSERVAGYATMIARTMGYDMYFQARIHAMGLLHDVGKIGVPEEIINKPDRLTDDEFAQIKKHTIMGYEILQTITEMPELATGARWHHERYDGRGYPDGKKGEDIPIEARIICVADCYDAMTSSRSYSNMRRQESVRSEFEKCSGSQFDPEIARIMIQLIDSDKSYLMNEQNYKYSSVAAVVDDVLDKTTPFGTSQPEEFEEQFVTDDTDALTDDYISDEDAEEDEKLPEWLTACPGIDTDAGIAYCGSPSGFLEVLTGFYANIDDKSSEIEQLYNDENWKDYTIKVHALKSSSRIVGMSELSEQARLLEEAGDNGDIDTIRRDTDALLEKYRSYKPALSGLDKEDENDRSTLPEADVATMADAYGAMSEFADSMDYELMKMVIEQMEGYRLPAEDEDKMKAIKAAHLKLDWDKIKEILGN